MILLILIIVHLLVCLLLYIGQKRQIFVSRTTSLVVALLIPIWGVLLFLVEERTYHKDDIDKDSIDIASLRVKDAKYKRIEVSENRNEEITVPLEEAIAINDSLTRRKIMMDVINQAPSGSVDLLISARDSNDTELAHFATTTMMQIQGQYEADIQEYRKKLEQNPDDVTILRRYKNTLLEYLNSGLLSGNVMDVYRDNIDTVLLKLVQLEPGNVRYIYEFIEDRIAINKLEGLEDWLRLIPPEYANKEDTFRVSVDYYAAIHRGDKIREILNYIEREEIYLNSKGKKWFQFWRGQV